MTSPNDIDPSLRNRLIQIGFPEDSDDWKQGKAIFSSNKLEILGHPVMETWESPYMETLAKIVTRNSGKILEIGFGMGLSAGFIQECEPEEHTIIEVNCDVFAKLEEFSDRARSKVIPLLGDWRDLVPSLASNSFDGILFDTYANTKKEMEDVCEAFGFFDEAYRLLKLGGIFTFYSSQVKFNTECEQGLRKAGFSNIDGISVPVPVPKDCLYWSHDRILAPIIIK